MTGAFKLTFDPRADALYIHLRAVEPAWQREHSENVILDFDTVGRLVGVEILHPGGIELGKVVRELGLDDSLVDILARFERLMPVADRELVLA